MEFHEKKLHYFIFIFYRQLLGTEEESSDHASSEDEELLMENYSAGPASSTVNSGKYVYLCIKSGFSISTALMYFDPSIPRNLEIST